MLSTRLLPIEIRNDFPIFEDPRLVYLDTAASAQKPRAVLQTLQDFYSRGYANIHRGVYPLSEKATVEYDSTRERLAQFLGAESAEEIVFTHGTTEGINLVASSWGETYLDEGDEIVVTLFEHHANFVPWQRVAQRTGAKVRYLFPAEDLSFPLEEFQKLLSERTKLVAVTQLANALGIAPPIKEIISAAHRVGALVLVDGAQGITHSSQTVRDLDVDFYVFSGHKLYGPTGSGGLYAKRKHLESMPPFLSGGDMIRRVSVEGTEFADPPARFEAGTPDIAGVIGLGAALQYVSTVGREAIRIHEQELVDLCESGLREIPGVEILGPQGQHRGLLVFHCEDVHPHDLSQALASESVCVRAGHHCNQPLLTHLNLPATTRASFGMYNTVSDVERFLEAMKKALRFFRR